MPRQASKAKERVYPGPLGKGYDDDELMSKDFLSGGNKPSGNTPCRTRTKRAPGQFRVGMLQAQRFEDISNRPTECDR